MTKQTTCPIDLLADGVDLTVYTPLFIMFLKEKVIEMANLFGPECTFAYGTKWDIEMLSIKVAKALGVPPHMAYGDKIWGVVHEVILEMERPCGKRIA